MHQPLYKDSLSGEYIMPWVLYHGTKDYYDMAAILDGFPEIHQTFNLVPSLIAQLNDYASGTANDRYRLITATPASQLKIHDKAFLIRNFFQANWDNMIRPLPRYLDLARKRGQINSEDDVHAVIRYFVEQDYLDLQVLFNLAWIDPVVRSADRQLKALVDKGRQYTEEDKALLLKKQIEIIGMILPRYKDMQERGSIEVSTTPFYHPIMPLLCDSHCATEAMPGMTLPKKRFLHPEDAATQIQRAVALYRESFGRDPQGMWPSEGSVSMDIIPLLAAEGIKWIATDEEILSNTVKRPIRRDSSGNCHDSFIYRPYSVDSGALSVSVVFRDHVLSDLIGFDYARMDPDAAANDLVNKLDWLSRTIESPDEHIVNIILDGENAWENFRNDGHDFLAALYSKLTAHQGLRCTTVSEFLNAQPRRERLQWIYPGSWISHNFKIWIGHHEDNMAWDYIADARDALVKYESSLTAASEYHASPQDLKDAWEEIYIAEGSDWFWWYGDEHSTLCDEHFDTLFRNHIKKIYTLIGQEPPDQLDIPIISEVKGVHPTVLPSAYIQPVIDGEITNYFEWLAAGRFEQTNYGSSMHRELQSGGFIAAIVYGFSKDALFFRFDYTKHPSLKPGEVGIGEDKSWSFSLNILTPKVIKINGEVVGKATTAVILEKDIEKGQWMSHGIRAEIASDSVVEMKIDLATINAKPGDEVRGFVMIDAKEKGPERWPVKGFLIINVPPEGFEEENWSA